MAKRNIAEVLRVNSHARATVRKTPCWAPSPTPISPSNGSSAHFSRSVLALMHETRHPVGLITKSSGVERDIDLLADMVQARRVGVYITIKFSRSMPNWPG